MLCAEMLSKGKGRNEEMRRCKEKVGNLARRPVAEESDLPAISLPIVRCTSICSERESISGVFDWNPIRQVRERSNIVPMQSAATIQILPQKPKHTLRDIIFS